MSSLSTKQTRLCSVNELQAKYKPKIKQYISEGEKVLYCFEVKSVPGLQGALLGLLNFSTHALDTQFWNYIITERQLVFVGDDQFFQIISSSILISDIVNVQESTYADINSVAVRGHNQAEIKCFFASQSDSHKFAEALREVMAKTKTSSKPTPSDSHSDSESRLRKLSQLLKDGLITETEYQQKRKEIIDQL